MLVPQTPQGDMSKNAAKKSKVLLFLSRDALDVLEKKTKVREEAKTPSSRGLDLYELIASFSLRSSLWMLFCPPPVHVVHVSPVHGVLLCRPAFLAQSLRVRGPPPRCRREPLLRVPEPRAGESSPLRHSADTRSAPICCHLR